MEDLQLEYIEGQIDVFIENNIKELKLRKGIGKHNDISKRRFYKRK